jgi:hypothetical protein
VYETFDGVRSSSGYIEGIMYLRTTRPFKELLLKFTSVRDRALEAQHSGFSTAIHRFGTVTFTVRWEEDFVGGSKESDKECLAQIALDCPENRTRRLMSRLQDMIREGETLWHEAEQENAEAVGEQVEEDRQDSNEEPVSNIPEEEGSEVEKPWWDVSVDIPCSGSIVSIPALARPPTRRS